VSPFMRVLVTGAAGTIGTYLREGLPRLGYELTLLDRHPVPGANAILGDVRDAETMQAATRGMDAVVHLAAINDEAPFEEMLDVDVLGTFRTFEAARCAGVQRIIYASSNHVQGLSPRAPSIGVMSPLRPDTYYALGKIMGESLARLYVDRFGMAVACLRIGTCRDVPVAPRHLSTWLSPGDAVRLVDACLRSNALGYAVIFGISANSRAWWDAEPGRLLGYDPQDDAETFAEAVLGGAVPVEGDAEHELLGGSFAITPLGRRTVEVAGNQTAQPT
jgi:uronate dehydrogenase